MRFKKVYIEITNVCNFSCSFCFKSKRAKRFISPEDFSAILFSIKPYTDYIYLHVLGEPLLHPDFEQLVSMAHDSGFHVNLTTNGSLIVKRLDYLLTAPIRQFNISLHDAEENIKPEALPEYLSAVFSFVKQKSLDSYMSMRLWNRGTEISSEFNRECLDALNEEFGTQIDASRLSEHNIKLMPHVFLQNAARFSWPGVGKLGVEQRSCYALDTHVAILVDGTVVPCCLDADGAMPLGNVLLEDFGGIIESERAKKILEGFRNNEIVEPICRDCGFKIGGI
ncbi:MAG TPA: radical SAM/SPASM domain-containing protein [Paludibacteraceae bacterium]|jgi:MoaA/NifB/PqqE/SkfB family radical SAM enzyme|nr:radical SAM/SPASM domain-containing protein [Paludibacteraceae bacterium]HPH62442.1 radical SAM/SPASM domain-containing protein [Paludibacteraceae bacterium]